jgi:phosphoribosylamine--glycine ligase
MIKPNGDIKVLEFNCRMGDPETQPILMRLRTDFTVLLEAALGQKLHEQEAEWDPRTALGVVIAAEGYPDDPHINDPIEALPKNAEDCMVFHAGTTLKRKKLVTSGGRVLCVTALGSNVKTAQKRAYEAVSEVQIHGMQYRTDIGHRAIKKSS